MTELMNSGLELLVAGMGIVFLFLTMLVVAINLMSAMVLRFFPDEPKAPSSSSVVSSNDKRIVAAITAAVHQYRHDHK